MEEDTFRRSPDPRKKALAALTDGAVVGAFSCHGVEPGRNGASNEAKINQDCACIAHPLNGDGNAAIFCVYDGHGQYGAEVSMQVLQSVRHALADAEGARILTFGRSASSSAAVGPATLRVEPERALTEVFEAVQPHLATTASRVAVYKDVPFNTSKGPCPVSTIAGGTIK